MSRIIVYTTEPCGYCRTAKALLQKRSIPFEEINLAKDPEGRAELVRLTGMMTFPQVVIDDEPIGGYQELVAAMRAGRLTEFVEARGLASAPPHARARLAALAHVGPASRGAQLAHRAAALDAREPFAAGGSGTGPGTPRTRRRAHGSRRSWRPWPRSRPPATRPPRRAAPRTGPS